MYCHVLGSFNNFNIIRFTNKTTSSEYFDVVHKVVLGGISDNILYLIQLVKCGAINSADPSTVGYCVINYLSELYTLQ